ncbi:MAG: MarR family transcriptional regulator [Rhodospirillaceae bacterium]|nr:MarR family transcriptional regulator [Rhodospirillaceae bacterium]
MFLLRDLAAAAAVERSEKAFGPIDADAVLLFLTVLKAGSDLLNALDDFLAAYGLRHGRWMTLVLLLRQPGQTAKPSDLAESQGVARATMTGLLEGLEKDELIERLPDPSDGRGQLVRLTGKGRATLMSVMPAYYARVKRLLDGVKPKRIARTTELLALMQDRTDRLSGEQPAPDATGKKRGKKSGR